MFNQASTLVKVAVGLICANWVLCCALAWAVGGTAFYGEIVAGEFFVRLGVSTPSVAVSSAFWGFSLVYTVLTVGGTFPGLALLYVFHKPSWDRDVGDLFAVATSVLLLLAVLLYSASRIAAWAAA